ncbi:MAG TPA: TldD/PmbA family protein [Actinobacteria bacterium]|nr:TldD/PmbA family protein [Actinomycetota bacterium]
MTHRHDMLEKVLDRVGSGVEAEIRLSTGVESLTRFANSFIHQNVSEEVSTMSLRVALDGRVASASGTVTDEETLERLVETAIDAAQRQPVDPDWPGVASPSITPATEHWDAETADAAAVDRARKVKEFVDAGTSMKAAGYCSSSSSEVFFVNTRGHFAAGRATTAILDGIHQTGRSAGSGHQTDRALSGIDAHAVGSLAAQRAVDSVETYDIKPGEYEVVLSQECVATIAMFLGAYGFNAKVYDEGMSFVDMDTRQFDESFTMVDDALDGRGLAVPFDSEGTSRRRVELVVGGVTKGLTHDRRTAKKAGVESTGNALPGGDTFGPTATQVFVDQGEQTVDDMIAGVERGLYVATFNYCRVLDPKSLAVTGLTRNGTFVIENGKITGAVNGLRFTQSFVEALGPDRILGLGNDARWADSEFGPGMIHSPSVRLSSWNFTGGTDG